MDALIDAVNRFMREERWAEALLLLRDHDAASRMSFELAWNRGWAHFKREEWEAARRWLGYALELEPDSPIALWAQGVACREAGAFEQAELRLLEALSVRDASIARLDLADLYVEQGRFARAEAVHLEGIRLKPDSAQRLTAYADFLLDAGREEEAHAYEERARTAEGEEATDEPPE